MHKKKLSLELLHHILGHRSARSILAGGTADVWQYIDLSIDPEPLCTSCQILTINKNTRPKKPLNPNTPFKWVFMEIIPAKYYTSLTKDTTFANYLLIVDDYSNIKKLYGIENITTEEVMDKLDMFQAIFGKVYEFG